jgi:hypothetical protein
MLIKNFHKLTAKSFWIIFILMSFVFPIKTLADVSLDPADIGGIMSEFGTIPLLIDAIINWFLTLTAAVTILFLIIGGIYYITAFGDDKKMEEGKKIISYAVYGLIMILISYSLVTTVNFIICGGAC